MALCRVLLLTSLSSIHRTLSCKWKSLTNCSSDSNCALFVEFPDPSLSPFRKLLVVVGLKRFVIR